MSRSSHNSTIRLILYEVLTQLIIWLGFLRARLIHRFWMKRPSGRVFDLYKFDSWICCDCGLEHNSEYFGPGYDCGHQAPHEFVEIVGHSWPMRPLGYRYKLRIGAEKPSLAIPRKDIL